MIRGFRALVNWGYRVGRSMSNRDSIKVVKNEVRDVVTEKRVCCLCRKNEAVIKGYCRFCYEAIQNLSWGI
jgi:hypothetical protein